MCRREVENLHPCNVKTPHFLVALLYCTYTVVHACEITVDTSSLTSEHQDAALVGDHRVSLFGPRHVALRVRHRPVVLEWVEMPAKSAIHTNVSVLHMRVLTRVGETT